MPSSARGPLGLSARRPRRRRGSTTRNIHVAAAAPPRPVSTEYPRRGHPPRPFAASERRRRPLERSRERRWTAGVVLSTVQSRDQRCPPGPRTGSKQRSRNSLSRAYSCSAAGQPGRWPWRNRQNRTFSRPQLTRRSASYGDHRTALTSKSESWRATVAYLRSRRRARFRTTEGDARSPTPRESAQTDFGETCSLLPRTNEGDARK